MNKLSVAALACAVLLPMAAMAQNIAIVNGKAVPKSRLDQLLAQVAKSGQPAPPDLEKRARDEVVMREIFVQEAEKRGLQSSNEYKQQMEMARQQLLIAALFEEQRKKAPITDAESKAEYDKLKGANAGTEYRARHILVEKEDEAKSLIKQINGGAKFDELAKKHSKDAGSGANGGDLDYAAPGSYVPEFSQAMVKLKKGEVTQDPVKSQFGFHIIKLEDTRDAQFPPFEEVKGRIQQQLQQQKLASFRDELRTKAKTDYKFSE
jgi:peptidyl-prolyl cis-trans isomerase C